MLTYTLCVATAGSAVPVDPAVTEQLTTMGFDTVRRLPHLSAVFSIGLS